MGQDKAVSLAEVSGQLLTEGCKGFLQTWLALREGDIAPHHAHFEMEQFAGFLPHVVLMEHVSDEEWIFRFVGSNLNQVQGAELTGLNFVDLAPPEDRAMRVRRLALQARLPAGSLFYLPGDIASGPTIEYEVLALPVLPDEPGQPFTLAALSFPVEPDDYPEQVVHKSVVRVADRFYLIDIGTRLPEDVGDLACTGLLAVA